MWHHGSLVRKLHAWLGGRNRARARRNRQDAERRGLPQRHQHYTGPFADGPWGDIERAFSYHRPGSTPREHLNRVAQEQAILLGLPPLPWLDEGSSTAVYENWPITRLAQIPRLHDRDVPRDDSTPLVILEVGRKAGLLDGHTRVNKWAKDPGNVTRQVIVIRPKHQVPPVAGVDPRPNGTLGDVWPTRTVG